MRCLNRVDVIAPPRQPKMKALGSKNGNASKQRHAENCCGFETEIQT